MANFDSFKPVLMLAQLVLAARKSLIWMNVCNLNIGMALRQKGSKITINTLGDPTANDTDESNPMTYEALDTTSTDLEITLDKTVSVKLRDQDKKQIESGGQTLEQAIANRMVYVLRDPVDTLIAGKYTEATVDNYETGTTAWQWGATPTAAEIAKFFAGVHYSMDAANCESDGRFCVLPNIAIQGIRIALGTIETSQGDSARQNGVVLRNAYGFDMIGQSPNCVTAASVTHGMAGNLANIGQGVPGCIAAAVQIDPNIEKLRLEGYWADGIRARITAGAKVYKADRCVDINLNEDLLA